MSNTFIRLSILGPSVFVATVTAGFLVMAVDVDGATPTVPTETAIDDGGVLTNAAAVGLRVASSGGTARGFGACGPGAGSCFDANGTPGCDDVSCCNTVCAADLDCCFIGWDSYCVGGAQDLCGGGPSCPAAGSCFSQHGNPGCDDVGCCSAVCADDPLCCALDWESTCVNLARQLCDTDACPGTGSCFQPHATPSCDDNTCCTVVCGQDPECCDVEWDCVCAETAGQLCGNEVCPGEGSCFQDHSSPGCNNEVCCDSVCAADPKCCTLEWDSLCVQRAEDLCPSCPGEGACFAANGSPGCSEAACCSLVCAGDPWCCEVEWDGRCATSAADLCVSPSCPGTGDCLAANDTPGCEETRCCNAVCLADPECCSDGWDSLCADRARDECGACPGLGRCDLPNGTPGCEQDDCCSMVCAASPECCEEEWNLACATAAREMCRDPACPGEGDCSTVQSGPGCNDEACCNAVCSGDPFCCFNNWDMDCVATAAERCVIPNDELDLAIPIRCGELHRGTTAGAANDPDPTFCGAEIAAPGVWYGVTGTGEEFTLDTCSAETNYDTSIAVYTGACPRSLTCVAGNDNECGAQSSLTWLSEVGVRYLVLVHGADGQTGDFTLRLRRGPGCPEGMITWVDPPDGVVDARQPPGVTALHVEGPCGTDPACWQPCGTGRDGPNVITSVVEDAPGRYRLLLGQPITSSTAVIRYQTQGGSIGACFRGLPGNVDGDAHTGPIDILKLVDCLNGVAPESSCPWGLYSCDADHSLVCDAEDLLLVITLLRGDGPLLPGWNGAPLPLCPVCPE